MADTGARTDPALSREHAPVCRPAATDRATIYEKSRPGRSSYSLPELGVPEVPVAELIPESLRRTAPARLPEISEIDLLRHFTGLSTLNYGVDSGSYPLGSCTMKYNPRVNEVAARLDGFAGLHPYQPESLVQGALELMYELEGWLAEISGLHVTTLQPAAGAHGELTGLLVIRAAHLARAATRSASSSPTPRTARTRPASSWAASSRRRCAATRAAAWTSTTSARSSPGATSPASCSPTPTPWGCSTSTSPRSPAWSTRPAACCTTTAPTPTPCSASGRPGDMGFDIVHFNPHKTFSTPHGGGGPGAGPIVVRDALAPFLPVPLVEKAEDGRFFLQYDRPQSIGKVRTFYGNFGVLVRAWTYIRSLGAEGLREVSETAVLNANYVMEGLRGLLDLPYGDRRCMHEFVGSATPLKQDGVRALDVAKRLLDYGVHPPTTYFPLIVDEALMLEPTETESKDALDRLIEAFRSVERRGEGRPAVCCATHRSTLPVRRLDEAQAARRPVVKQRFPEDEEGGA